MAIYIKANHLVAKALKLEDERLETKDGGYILWQADMLRFGSLIQLNEILENIGAIALTPTEAREEQDGTKVRELPLAVEEQFQYNNPYPYHPEPPTVPDNESEEELPEPPEMPDDFINGPAEPLPELSENEEIVEPTNNEPSNTIEA